MGRADRRRPNVAAGRDRASIRRVGIISACRSTRRAGALCTAFLTRAAAAFTGLPLCRARASQCKGVLAWERARREFQPRLPAAVFVDERELPVCLWGLRQSYSDRFLLAQLAHRQLSVLPGEMLICAARKALIVTFEMVDDHGVVEEKLTMAGTAEETDQGDQQRYRAPFHRAAIR